ncbi:hypothetical protein BDN72DRAFT_902968 [Pluteus cervinus]|uniref:Uncharacterized protein n=1 Tax=Pluteus cervinus TaxID=181527 RepID=A0ACD3AAS6_9AGAR|nr:hypothetical protein BDN72DRAFT_902968 [Pluteus cervinus]
MSQDSFPSDILLLVCSHLDSQSKQQLCLVSRYFHSIFAPLVLRNVRILFCEERASTFDSIDNRLKTCSSKLTNLYQHAQALRVKTNSFYLSRGVTESLLPALWTTIQCLTSLKSLELEWERHSEENLQTMEEYQRLIIESVLYATDDRLDQLVLLPAASSQTLPEPLQWIRGLKSLRVVHDQRGWGCSYLWYDSDEDRVCHCHRAWMNETIKPLIAANPDLETLEIAQGCRSRGPEPNDVLPASLKSLRSLTISGLKIPSVQKMGTPLVELSPLRNLRHLTVRAQYKWLKIDAFWGALNAAQPPLETLVSFQVCPSMVNYLNSFSGLRTLEIERIEDVEECHSPELLSMFLEQVLPRHAHSLERLAVHYQEDISALSGWDFDRDTWAPSLVQLRKLQYLAIYPPPRSQLTRSYQSLLDSVSVLPNLVTLRINHPEPTFGCGTGYMQWSSAVQRTMNKVVPKLRVKEQKPRELVVFTGMQRCVALEGEEWGYNPVRDCVPEVDSSDEDECVSEVESLDGDD